MESRDTIHLHETFAALPDALRLVCGDAPGKLCVVTDENVAERYLEEVRESLEGTGIWIDPFVFPAGERSKDLHIVQALYRHLQAQEIERSDLLLALGGGVVGDLTGFAASTYLRGVRFLALPTTLLAMADSCLGGKTGIHLDGIKNRIGTFYDASAQYLCLKTIQTLSEQDYRCGLAEILKTAIVGEEQLFRQLENKVSALLHRDLSTLSDVLASTLALKQAIVRQDPYDTGYRHILNFGHTIGHAIETLSDFQVSHGDAVSVGMTGALTISEAQGLLSASCRTRIESLQGALALPIRMGDLSFLWGPQAEESLRTICRLDKKRENGEDVFVLLSEIGHALPHVVVDEETIRKALHDLFT